MEKWMLISTLIIAFFVAIIALRPWLRAIPAGARARINPSGLISRFILMPVRARMVALVIPLIVLCVTIYMFMHGAVGVYWGIIFSVLSLTTVVAIFYEPLRDRYESVLHQLRHNNNWRLGLLFVLAIMFSLSAFIAGFGEPILAKDVREIAAKAEQYFQEDNAVSTTANYILFGKKEPLIEKKEEAAKKEKKEYPTWWHWKAAILFWVLTLIYFPIAIRDEIATAWRRAVEKVEKATEAIMLKKETDVTTQAPEQATATVKARVSKEGIFGGRFTSEVIQEFLAEIGIELTKFFIKRRRL
jgi:hypothetical protein